MRFKVFKIIFIVLIVLLFLLATFFLVKGLMMEEEDTKVEEPSIPSMPSVDVEEVMNELKGEYSTLLYESREIKEFTSLAFFEENRVVSFLIDAETGENLQLEDIIKEGMLDKFLEKESELLMLKYPEFIVDGIKNSDGEKVYLVKNNEMIVYYYDYTYEYDYEEVVSLKINYNEVHDYLDFTHILDSEYENEDGYHYSEEKKTVAITFDDGPSSKYNQKFLDVLAKNKAHATFFMVGTMMYNCQKCVLNTYKSGNEVASHTYSHINITKNSSDTVNANIKKTDDLFYQITGDHIKYVRPPYGSYNKENLANINYPLILWNIDTEDWRYKDVDRIVSGVMDNVSDGSIILMHELYETSLEALEIILPKLYVEGYQVVSVSELASLKGRTIEVGHAYRKIS